MITEIRLAYTTEEMIEYLRRKGYDVYQETEELETHFHGSLFIKSTGRYYVAKKDGDAEHVKDAFRQEIKRSLLTL